MTSNRKKKIIYIIIVLILLVFMYSICSIKMYGTVYFPSGNGNRAVWNIEKLNAVTKDFELQDDGSFLSVSPDPWFTIEEGFPVKTILVETKGIDEPQNAQVFYYSDSQELDEKYSYYFKLKQGVNYLQIPDGRFNRFRLDMTDSSGIRMYIDNVTVCGSRTVSSRSLMLLLGIWGIVAKLLYHMMRVGK